MIPELPEKRREYLAQGEHVLGGILTPESFTLAQAFAVGKMAAVECILVESGGR